MTRPDLTRCTTAAARAWHARIQAERRDSARFRPDGQLWQWEDLTPHDQHALRSLVLPIVVAVVDVITEDQAAQPRATSAEEVTP